LGFPIILSLPSGTRVYPWLKVRPGGGVATETANY
jgi:hypothetical protein